MAVAFSGLGFPEHMPGAPLSLVSFSGPVQHTHSVDHPEWYSHLSPGQNLGQGTVSAPFVYWG